MGNNTNLAEKLSIQENWTFHQKSLNGNNVYINSHAQQVEQYLIPFDKKLNIQEEFQIYYYRKIQNSSIVKIIGADIYDSNTTNFCGNQKTSRIFTQRIQIRLSQIYNIPFLQSVYALNQVLRGYKQIYQRSVNAPTDINDNMIGITPQGFARVWINENFGLNHAPVNKVNLYGTNNNYYLDYSNQKGQQNLVTMIVQIIQRHCQNGAFPLEFKNLYQQKSENFSFSNMNNVIQNFITKKNINLPDRITFKNNSSKQVTQPIQTFQPNLSRNNQHQISKSPPPIQSRVLSPQQPPSNSKPLLKPIHPLSQKPIPINLKPVPNLHNNYIHPTSPINYGNFNPPKFHPIQHKIDPQGRNYQPYRLNPQTQRFPSPPPNNRVFVSPVNIRPNIIYSGQSQFHSPSIQINYKSHNLEADIQKNTKGKKLFQRKFSPQLNETPIKIVERAENNKLLIQKPQIVQRIKQTQKIKVSQKQEIDERKYENNDVIKENIEASKVKGFEKPGILSKFDDQFKNMNEKNEDNELSRYKKFMKQQELRFQERKKKVQEKDIESNIMEKNSEQNYRTIKKQNINGNNQLFSFIKKQEQLDDSKQNKNELKDIPLSFGNYVQSTYRLENQINPYDDKYQQNK